MKYGGDVRHRQIGMWLPYNYWQIVGENMKLPPDVVQAVVNELKNYMLFAVADYTVSSTEFSFMLEDEIQRINNILRQF